MQTEWIYHINIAEIPGISFQSITSENVYDHKQFGGSSVGLALQSKLSIGYNKKLNFFGFCYSANNYWIDNASASSMNYKFSSIKFYYGHRFTAGKLLKKYI